MDEGLKKRLIGATVLVSLVVIFVPMLLEEEPVVSTELEDDVIPNNPGGDFSSKVLPLETEDLSKPPLVASDLDKPAPEPTTVQDEVKTETGSDSQPDSSAEEKSEPATRVGLSAWVIQVGSFSKSDNADKLVKDLQQHKYAAFTDQVDLNGKIMHRVLVGPEVDKKRAEQMLKNLNKYLKDQKLTGKLKSYN
ncbi:MAG: SPOR domain-containing protein [Gammaproteobacteria bacterium]